MGFFDLLCQESELVLGGATAFILIGEHQQVWTPVAVPLCNSYDRLGRIDMPGKSDEDCFNENASLLTSFLKQCKTESGESPKEKSLEDLVDEHLKEGFLLWEGIPISYCLVDQRIYNAIAKTVEAGGQPEWELYSTENLDKLEFESLFESAFALGNVSKAIYQPIADCKHWLSEPLKTLYRYRAWGAQFQAFDLFAEDGPGQCCGYQGEYGSQAYCDKARETYKSFPLILKAIEENADYWKELDEDDEDE